MIEGLYLRVRERSDVGEARRRSTAVAAEAGMDEADRGRLAIAATEMASNLVRHAPEGGAFFVRSVGLVPATPGGERGVGVELLAVDKGPGIVDVPRALEDGFSTRGSAGTGMGAVVRQCNVFEIHSVQGTGTVSLARVDRGRQATLEGLDAAVDMGVVHRPHPLERTPGDGWSVRELEGGYAVVVADGLGHGPDAKKASDAVVRSFQEAPWDGPVPALERMHEAARSTRGAAVSVVEVREGEGRLCFAGVGNVGVAVVEKEDARRRSLAGRNGTVGHRIGTPRMVDAPWTPGDLAVIYSDGIQNRWSGEELASVLGRPPSLVAGMLYLLHYRGRDDATAVVLRGRG